MRSSPARGALPMTTWEKRVPKTASTFCVGELLDHLGAALRVGAVVLEQDLDRAAVDAAGVVEPSSAAEAVRSYQRP